MQIIKKDTEVEVGTLKCGDVFETLSGKVCMVVSGAGVEDDPAYPILIVDLERGLLDHMREEASVRPMELVAKEK